MLLVRGDIVGGLNPFPIDLQGHVWDSHKIDWELTWHSPFPNILSCQLVLKSWQLTKCTDRNVVLNKFSWQSPQTSILWRGLSARSRSHPHNLLSIKPLSSALLIAVVDCWQNKTASDGSDTAVSSSKHAPGTDAGVTNGRFRPPTERPPAPRPPTERPPAEPARHPCQRPPQPRQTAVDEFRRPNPDELVLGFRRHRMMSHRQPVVTARQVIYYYY